MERRRQLALLIIVGFTILALLLKYWRVLMQWFETHEHLLN